MNKAIVVPPDRAEDALEAAAKLVSLSESQLELTRELSEKLNLTGEIELSALKRLVRLQTDIRTLVANSAALTAGLANR